METKEVTLAEFVAQQQEAPSAQQRE